VRLEYVADHYLQILGVSLVTPKHIRVVLAAAVFFVSWLPTVASASVVATANSSNTANDSDAFTIFNGDTININEVRLTFSISGQGAWDDNLPGQPAFAFTVDLGSSSTGVVHSYSDPSPARADFHAFRTLVLSFTDFSPGETLVFGADSDGSIGTSLSNFGANNTGAFAGLLDLSVVTSDGRTGSATFQSVSGQLIRAEATLVPEPSSDLICFLSLTSSLVWRRSSRPGRVA
jgi:hypothetical protein